MVIKLECKECGNTNQSLFFYDEKRCAVWCNGCGSMDQLQLKEYDWVVEDNKKGLIEEFLEKVN